MQDVLANNKALLVEQGSLREALATSKKQSDFLREKVRKLEEQKLRLEKEKAGFLETKIVWSKREATEKEARAALERDCTELKKLNQSLLLRVSETENQCRAQGVLLEQTKKSFREKEERREEAMLRLKEEHILERQALVKQMITQERRQEQDLLQRELEWRQKLEVMKIKSNGTQKADTPSSHGKGRPHKRARRLLPRKCKAVQPAIDYH